MILNDFLPSDEYEPTTYRMKEKPLQKMEMTFHMTANNFRTIHRIVKWYSLYCYF